MKTELITLVAKVNFEEGKRSMIPLLREAFEAGQDNIDCDGCHIFNPEEAYIEFLKENNIEI